MKLIKFLKEYGLSHFQKSYNVRLNKNSDIFSISYGHGLTYEDWKDPVLKPCRGIVLDYDFNIISYPYDKFFNFSAPVASLIDWSSAKVYRKEDGVMACLYYYKGGWNISTTSSPDGKNTKWLDGKSFSDLFFETWEKLNYKYPKNTDLCYIFELILPSNKFAIVKYTEPKIILHGVRNLKTLEEIDPMSLPFSWEKPEIFKMESLYEVIKKAKELNPFEQEGFVVCDKNFNRIKVKSPEHFKLIKIRPTTKDLLSCFLEEKKVPLQYKEEYDKVVKILDKLCNKLDNNFKNLPITETEKNFAEIVKNLEYSDIYFKMNKTNKNANTILRDMNFKKLLKIVKKEIKK